MCLHFMRLILIRLFYTIILFISASPNFPLGSIEFPSYCSPLRYLTTIVAGLSTSCSCAHTCQAACSSHTHTHTHTALANACIHRKQAHTHRIHTLVMVKKAPSFSSNLKKLEKKNSFVLRVLGRKGAMLFPWLIPSPPVDAYLLAVTSC